MSIKMLNSDGSPAFGLYTGEVCDISLLGYNKIAKWLQPFRRKRWRFVGIFSKQVVAGIAVVDAGYIGSTFAYAFDMETKTMSEFRATSPLATCCSISDHATRGEAVFKKGMNEVKINYAPDNTNSSVFVNAKTPNGQLKIDVQLDESMSGAVPHQAIMTTPKDFFAFTHKSAGFPVNGSIQIGSKIYDIKDGEAFGAADHTVGYHDYHWEWRWASLGGISENGKRFGINLVDPIPHETIQENAMWIDGMCFPLGRAIFNFDRKSILEPWEIYTNTGVVNLKFKPLGMRSETINAGIIKSRFCQPVGLYSGKVKAPNGEVIILKDIPGVAEDHEARW